MSRRGPVFYLVMLVFGHFLVDMGGGILPALMPSLMDRFDTKIFGAATLLMLFKLAGNAGQPIFGFLADRSERVQRLMFFMPVLVFVPLFMPFVGSYAQLCVLLVMGGVALALFHPTSVRQVQRLPGFPRGTVMGVFLGLGFGGFAAGGVVGAVLVEEVGLSWIWLPIIPGALAAAGLLAGRHMVGRAIDDHAKKADVSVDHQTGYSFGAIWVTGFLIGTTSATLITLMPTYTDLVRGSVKPGGAANMGYGIAAAVGGLFVGALSDRFRRGYVCAAAVALAGVLLGLFFTTGGRHLWLFSLAGLGPGATFPVLVAMSHEARGRESNWRNGLMVGGCWGASNLLLPVFGAAADRWGLGNVLPALAALPPVIAVLFVVIERTKREETPCESPSVR